MFGFSWSQLILIGVVALVILGPEDMPKLFRTLAISQIKYRRFSRNIIHVNRRRPCCHSAPLAISLRPSGAFLQKCLMP